jgi:hypothetical protein
VRPPRVCLEHAQGRLHHAKRRPGRSGRRLEKTGRISRKFPSPPNDQSAMKRVWEFAASDTVAVSRHTADRAGFPCHCPEQERETLRCLAIPHRRITSRRRNRSQSRVAG